MKTLSDDVQRLSLALGARKWQMATAESCTGGMLAGFLTALAGSSAWFERGFVTYSNAAKEELLGVPHALITQHGAVSEAVALAMAEGALHHSHAQMAVSVTGIAGPDGGTPQKPVGTVWLAFAGNGMAPEARCYHFTGNREEVRLQTCQAAVSGCIARLLDMSA
ncbi:Competence-damage inducible protein CinA [Legionella geestiana]|uniref:Competence-damage inducible protein CinA n=1 Tax=Legionella geestiana TaxID=45065 RepID=A0A0W0TGY1_9GAMM|nr:CinA family protein [Legionella geestiana]KTC94749.1 Competence-damage inducible protein CinA [Legionella geestiana]QBS12696.1 CinA family protein [Legionella geestiana]STX54838.1 Competence-damage inducible protein CinA [Legionella geestiana]